MPRVFLGWEKEEKVVEVVVVVVEEVKFFFLGTDHIEYEYVDIFFC
jgi:hypothetical protein